MPRDRFEGIAACVFDAYGTLFDVGAAAERLEGALGEAWRPLADVWRSKQLEYAWLRSLMGRHADFWQVTGEALDYAMRRLGVEDAALRRGLMDLYLELPPYPDVKAALTRLKAGGVELAILSNGSPTMLKSATESAGLADLFDAVLSAEEVGVYKPHPSVYRLAVDRLGVPPERICFCSSNAWDASGAKAFGYAVVWCNRSGLPPENLLEPPDQEITSLAALPGLVVQG